MIACLDSGLVVNRRRIGIQNFEYPNQEPNPSMLFFKLSRPSDAYVRH